MTAVASSGPAASGTSGRNVDGEAVALTVFSTVRSWGLLELPLLFLFIRRGRGALKDLKQLSFIHAARWSLVRRLPGNGGQPETPFYVGGRRYFTNCYNSNPTNGAGIAVPADANREYLAARGF